LYALDQVVTIKRRFTIIVYRQGEQHKIVDAVQIAWMDEEQEEQPIIEEDNVSAGEVEDQTDLPAKTAETTTTTRRRETRRPIIYPGNEAYKYANKVDNFKDAETVKGFLLSHTAYVQR